MALMAAAALPARSYDGALAELDAHGALVGAAQHRQLQRTRARAGERDGVHGNDQPALEPHHVDSDQAPLGVQQRAAGRAAWEGGGVLDGRHTATPRAATDTLIGRDEAMRHAERPPTRTGKADDDG